jgi:3-carboxy-cis,cis-muconate cycloisomerase
VTGALGKIGQDVALMAQNGSARSRSGGGGSSAMAHKQNPVKAEVLVTLARFNAVQVGGLHQRSSTNRSARARPGRWNG